MDEISDPKFQTWVMGTADNSIVGYRWFVEVCEAYEDSAMDPEQFGGYNDIFEQYKISQHNACGFALFALETQDAMDFESNQVKIKSYRELLLFQVRFYRDQLINQYKRIKEAGDKLEKSLTSSP